MITSLTEAQVKQMQEYANKRIGLGHSTQQFTKETADPIIRNLYKHILLKSEPEEILLFPSPLSLWKHIQSVVGSKIPFVWSYLAGSFDANIFAYYDYCIEVLHVEIPEEFLTKYHYWKQTHILGPIYPFDDVCLVSQLPTVCSIKDGKLHNEKGPAIAYSDGLEIWALNGIIMKKEHVQTPWNKLNVSDAIKETNLEVRRELVRKIGIERIVKELGAKTLDTKGNYELLELKVGANRRPFLKMLNPSIGTYHIEGVPPNTKTVEDALEFRNGTKEDPVILT